MLQLLGNVKKIKLADPPTVEKQRAAEQEAEIAKLKEQLQQLTLMSGGANNAEQGVLAFTETHQFPGRAHEGAWQSNVKCHGERPPAERSW